MQIERLWKDFRQYLCTMKQVEEELNKETEALAKGLVNINSFIPAEKQKSMETKLELKHIVKKFINFLQYAVNNPKNKVTIISLLKVLRKLVDKEEMSEKEEIQCLMNKFGATRMVLIVLSESQALLDNETLTHFVMFLNSLLDEGNHEVQKTIFEFFTTYAKSEVIFQRFNLIIKNQIESITQKAKEKKSQVQWLDDEDSIQSVKEISKEEIIQSQEEEKLMNIILKFLQNCVEGHYLELQNYLRQQTSSRNSYNMINLVTDLLKAYYYEDKSSQMYENMIRCLDTLNELVQGPCPENQIAVAESKFFEIASELFGKKKEKQTSNTKTMQTFNINSSSTFTYKQNRS